MLFQLRMILSELSIGQSARLKSLSPTLNRSDLERLLELGFVAGTQVKLLRKGPLGSPLLFEIGDTQIGIRQEEAALFEVE